MHTHRGGRGGGRRLAARAWANVAARLSEPEVTAIDVPPLPPLPPTWTSLCRPNKSSKYATASSATAAASTPSVILVARAPPTMSTGNL